MQISDTTIACLVDFLDRRFGVDAVWIFGSVAQERARADSDLDVAALFRESPKPFDLLSARGDAEEIVGRPVDLVDLDRASPILAMQVLRYGRLVAEHDSRRRIRFTAGVPGRYEDIKRIRRPIEEALVREMLHGRP